MRFKFTIREELTKDVVIEAPNAEAAEEFLESEWEKSDKFMAPEDCMSDIDFICLGETNEPVDLVCRPVFRIVGKDDDED